LSVCMFVCLFACLFVCLFVCLYVSWLVCLFVGLFEYCKIKVRDISQRAWQYKGQNSGMKKYLQNKKLKLVFVESLLPTKMPLALNKVTKFKYTKFRFLKWQILPLNIQSNFLQLTANIHVKLCTVKLGYNKLGYNKLPVIMNKLFSRKSMCDTINYSGYNELPVTKQTCITNKFCRPKRFVITELHCI
jgi:hypothetical protein